MKKKLGTIQDAIKAAHESIKKMTPDEKAKVRRALDRKLLNTPVNTKPN